MNASAIVFMLFTVLIVWGGLAAATAALVMRNRREAKALREAALEVILEDTRG